MEVYRRLSRFMSRLGVPPEAQGVLSAVAWVISEEFSARLDADELDTPGRWRLRAHLHALSEHTREILGGMQDVVVASEELAVTAGAHWPLPGRREWLEPAAGGGVSFAATLSEEFATYSSAGLSVTAALVATPVLQVLEIYLAASARANAYRRHDLGYDRDVIATDLHAVLTGGTLGRSKSIGGRQMATEIGDWMIERAASAIWQTLAFGVGAAWAAAGTVRTVRRVSNLPLQATGQQTPTPPPAPRPLVVVDWLRAWRGWGPEGRPALPAG